MFKVNDTVIYGTDGICRMAEIAEREFNGVCETYYVLKPMLSPSSTILVPINNEVLVGRIRSLLSEEETRALIRLIPDCEEMAWIEDDKLRRETCRQILLRGDRHELVRMIKALSARQNRLKEIGKKLHASDERVFRDAERILYDEFAMTLGIARESVPDFISDEIGAFVD